ncbi:MAG: hypothetical protein LBK23_11490 [Oscillospiraceae bacterium]|jgi:hypothetical protein|nr:hypothetical protein [Oscillospiraceae bacterium]
MNRVYKDTYEDVYKLHAKFGRVRPETRDRTYWECVIAEARAYSKAHGDRFTTDLLVAMFDELECECGEVAANGEH